MAKFGDAAIRPLLRALDDTPVHIRQLAEMFRKHGQKHNRNTNAVTDLDRADVPEPLHDGWKKDTWTPNDVVGTGHGNRPDPSEYLDQSYVDRHLARFDEGASRIYKSDDLHKYGPGNGGVTFVFPTSELQKILDETGGDARALAIRLGMPSDYYLDKAGNPVDVEIRHFTPDELTGIRVPTGNEGGANPQWIPGGYLPTGDPEAVIDIPESATGHNSDYNHGLWPGTAQGLKLT